ncbi:MAG: extracellular solute-binding protein [Spirochaetales bacterium]
MKKILIPVIATVFLLGLIACNNSGSTSTANGTVAISMFYPDNPTLPYVETWSAFTQTSKNANLDVTIEPIPTAEYSTVVSLALNTGRNLPDVLMYMNTAGENASLALNGAVVPISDYSEWTPNMNAFIEKFGIQDEIDALRLEDGKLYYMPMIYDAPTYDEGLIMRADFVERAGFGTPTTLDDLYNILKAYKAENPSSYPLTSWVFTSITTRMLMPAFGVSFGGGSSSGSYVLSYDYDTDQYFAGAISNQAREFFRYMHKLYAEGLYDPEVSNGDGATAKIVNGSAIATYAWYDQISGFEAASEIEGYDLKMYLPLEGPAGAYHMEKSFTGNGLMFPIAITKRNDFEQIVRGIDAMFYSEENAKIWSIGVEGESYTMDGDTIVYKDEIVNSKDGIYKTLQVLYGAGSNGSQAVWENELLLTKYNDEFAVLNADIKALEGGNSIQPKPPTPLWDETEAEDVNFLRTPLQDAVTVWIDAFITGSKSVETDWNEYVTTMENLGIQEYLDLYNDNLR